MTIDPEYLNGSKGVADYASLSVRQARDVIKDPALPKYRLNRKTVLVKRSDFDQWIARYREGGEDNSEAVNEVVGEVLKDF